MGKEQGLGRLISKRHKKGLLPCHSYLLPPSGWDGDHHKHLSGLGRGAEERKGLRTGFLPVTSGRLHRLSQAAPRAAPCTPCRGVAPSEPPCSRSQLRTPSCPTWAPGRLVLVLLPHMLTPGLVS